MKLRSLALPVVASLAVAAITASVAVAPKRSETVKMRSVEAVVNDHVLVVAVPGDMVASSIPRGLRLSRANERAFRDVLEIDVTLQAAPLSRVDTRERKLRDGLARYRIEEGEGGSGGAEFTLTASRECESGTIRLVMVAQAQDGGKPDFGDGWNVLEGATCRVMTKG